MNKFQENIHFQIQSHLELMDKVGMDWTHKGTAYIGLAFEYFNMQEDEKGIELLTQIPASYFEQTMVAELKRNDQFLEVTLLLIDLMVKSPHIPKDSVIMKAFLKLRGTNYGNA